MDGNQETVTTPVVETPAAEQATDVTPAAQPQQYSNWNMDLTPHAEGGEPASQPAYQQPQPVYQQPGFQQPTYQQPAYQQPQPVYQQPGFQQPAGFTQMKGLQPAGPMKHAGSLIVLIAGGMAVLQFIVLMIDTLIRMRYMGLRWVSISNLVIIGSALIPIAIELLVTYFTAKRENQNPSRTGLIFGLIAGIIHLVLSFSVFIVLFIAGVGGMRIIHKLGLQRIASSFGISDRFMVRYGIRTILVFLLIFTVTWIIMHFALNSTRTNMMRRIQGRRYSLKPMFPAVMLFINAVPFLIYAVIYIGNIFSRFRRLSFTGMISAAGPVIIYGLMPVVLILCGIALIGLKKDK